MPTYVNAPAPRPNMPRGDQATAIGGAGYQNQNRGQAAGMLGPLTGMASNDFWTPINLTQSLGALPGMYGEAATRMSHLLGGSNVMGSQAGPTASDSGIGVGGFNSSSPYAGLLQQAAGMNYAMQQSGYGGNFRPSGIAGEHWVNPEFKKVSVPLRSVAPIPGIVDLYYLPGTNYKMSGSSMITKELADVLSGYYRTQRSGGNLNPFLYGAAYNGGNTPTGGSAPGAPTPSSPPANVAPKVYKRPAEMKTPGGYDYLKETMHPFQKRVATAQFGGPFDYYRSLLGRDLVTDRGELNIGMDVMPSEWDYVRKQGLNVGNNELTKLADLLYT